MYSNIAFGISALSALTILLLVVASFTAEEFQFWPPPRKGNWQKRTFIVLGRGFLYPLIVLTILEFETPIGAEASIQYGFGGALTAVGFGLAFLITFKMGWRNAFGEKRGLKTTGWFSRSRNPVYVVTWIGLLGWAILANSMLVTILLICWALFYVAAPFLEEPWLEEQYGDDYRSYKACVRRFF